MQSLKRIPIKIFVAILLCGMIGIFGELILNYDINKLTQNYNDIMDEYIVNINHVKTLTELLYRHNTLVASHIVCSDEDRMKDYEDRLKQIEDKASRELTEFGERMTGTDKEEYYHKVYSNYYLYINNVKVALHFSSNGNDKTAEYYVNDVLSEFITNFNQNINKLSEITNNELDMAKQKMLWYINISKISKSICIVLIFLSMIVCLSYCFKLTSKLSKYNDDLESEVALHTQKLKAQLEKMESLQSNTIIAMANLIETRDGETGEHVKRTSDYVRILAKAAQARGLYPDVLTDEYIDLLVKAAPVHDIGKISIPDSILKKPGRLTPEEFEVIKIHASEGGTIVHTIFGNIEDKKYVEMAATVAAAHHEKWSGEGYPYHLAGEDIPLCARIMAISDVFDALVSKRCYKDAMPVDSAFEIIRESAGSHFDPTLANIFIECRSEIEKVLCE